MKNIDYMLDAALKAGWTQLGPGIPVFFKIDSPGKNIMQGLDGSNPIDYCVRFVVTCDTRAYYDFYNMWIDNGTMKIEELDIERIFGTAYSTIKCPLDSFARCAASTIATHYFGNDVEKFIYYDNIETFLLNQYKNNVTTPGV